MRSFLIKIEHTTERITDRNGDTLVPGIDLTTGDTRDTDRVTDRV